MNQRSPFPWASLALFAFNGFAFVSLIGSGTAMVISAVSNRLQGTLLVGEMNTLLLRAAGVLLCGLLMLPSGILMLLRLFERPLPFHLDLPAARKPLLLVGAILVWVLALLVAWVVVRQAFISTLLLPPLFVLIVAIPVGWLLYMGMREIPGGSLQRRWGMFTLSLAGTTLVTIVVELVFILALLVVAVIAIVAHPEWANAVERLAQRLTTVQPTQENVTRILRPYLSQPWVIYTILVFYSGIAPLVEELLKPLPLWLLAGRRLTPAEGFVGGLVCGAGFALFESFGMLTIAEGDGWLPIAVARTGSDLLHILNTGLMGWALASAWGEGRLGRLAATYLGTVIIHGTWNALSVAFSFLPLFGAENGFLQTLQTWRLPEIGLGVLFMIMFGILIRKNTQLRQSSVYAPSGG